MVTGEGVPKRCHMCKFIPFQEKRLHSKLKKSDLDMAAQLPNRKVAMVRKMRGMRMRRTHAIYATLLIQGKLSTALVDSDSSVSLISWIFLQSLGFSGAQKDYKRERDSANITWSSVKGKPKLFFSYWKVRARVSSCFSPINRRLSSLSNWFDFLTEIGFTLYARERKNLWKKTRNSRILHRNNWQRVNVRDINFNGAKNYCFANWKWRKRSEKIFLQSYG